MNKRLIIRTYLYKQILQYTLPSISIHFIKHDSCDFNSVIFISIIKFSILKL